MIRTGEHTMQFNITNDTAAAKTYDLLDVNTSLDSGGVAEDITIENSGAVTAGITHAKPGQTWLQSQDGTLKSIQVYFRPPAPNNNAANIILRIKNYDTDTILATYTGLTSIDGQYITYDVNVDVEAGVNYSFQVKRVDLLVINLGSCGLNSYPDGILLNDDVPAGVDFDLYFILTVEVQSGGTGSDPDIVYQGDFTYDDIIRSFLNRPILMAKLTLISSSTDQLLNNIIFKNSKLYGNDKDETLNIQSFTDPKDVEAIVKIDFEKPVIFGRNEDETIEYTVDANTTAKLVFQFDFMPETEDIEDAEYEIINDEKDINNEQTVKILDEINKEPVINSDIIETGSEKKKIVKKLAVIFTGIAIILILTKYIKWIVK